MSSNYDDGSQEENVISIKINETEIIEQNLIIELNSQETECNFQSNQCLITPPAIINPHYSYTFNFKNSVRNITTGDSSDKSEFLTKKYQYLPEFSYLTFRKAKSSVDYKLSFKCEINFMLKSSNIENILSYGYLVFEENSTYYSLNKTGIECESGGGCSLETIDLKPNKNYRVELLLMSKFFNISKPASGCKTDESIPSSDYYPFKRLSDYSLTTNSIRFKQFDFNGSISNISHYWIYIVSSLELSDFQLLVKNLSNQVYLNDLVDQKDGLVCELSSTKENRQDGIYCPINKEPKTYKISNYICIGQQCSSSSSSVDVFIYDLKPSLQYAIFMLYSIPRSIRQKRNLISNGNGTSQYVAKQNEILFTSLVYTRDQIRNIDPLPNSTSERHWIIIIICISTIILILILIISIVAVKYYRNRYDDSVDARVRHNMKVKRHLSNKSGKYPQISDYEMPFVEPQDIRINEMESVWMFKHANCDLKFEDEYKNLPDFRDQKTCYCAEDKNNEGKNRFLDIKPYDESRVVLDNNVWLNGENCDYINANFIQGYSHKKKFIATQGPLKSTLGDFWHMIWQYRIHAVIMLTNLIEKGMERCAQYWPEQYNIPARYGDIEVTMRECVKIGDYIKRVFEVKSLNSNGITSIVTPSGSIKKSSTSKESNKILIVTQYFYPEWPDRDTPTTDAMSLLHLVRDVNRHHPSHQYPILVHCSAGVGRTGTYITLDAMFEKLNKESKFNAFTFIKQIREQRQYLVQTSKQYVFIHEALYEYCLYGFTDVEAGKLVAHYKNIKEIMNNHSKSKLQTEFEKLSIAYSQPSSQAREACNHMNKSRNRDLSIVCYDENRVKLSSLNGSSYINATKILVG
jgi:protein tyrosine phosphatase